MLEDLLGHYGPARGSDSEGEGRTEPVRANAGTVCAIVGWRPKRKDGGTTISHDGRFERAPLEMIPEEAWRSQETTIPAVRIEMVMANQSGQELSAKQRIEKATAERFLAVYNPRHGTDFQIVRLGDSPDVECEDRSSGKKLCLEITLLEDWEGDIQDLLGREERMTSSPVTVGPLISFEEDSVPKLRERLEKKLLSSYGSETALVIRQVGILWSAMHWRRYSQLLCSEILKGREENYGAGVWILCNDTTSWPCKDDIFLLTEGASESVSQEPSPGAREASTRVKATWEQFKSEDFDIFAAREDVDPVYRIESPHGCEESILIAFLKDESQDLRRKAIAFYREQMVCHCICGRGKIRWSDFWKRAILATRGTRD